MSRLYSIIFSILLCLPLQAKVRLHHLIANNMVLQQQTEVRLWGWAKAGREVKVATSWDNQSYRTKTNKDGQWLVKVKTPQASNTPYSITFDDGEPTVVSDVLVGEVWVCAGQSNMEMPMSGFGNCPVEGYTEAVVSAGESSGVHFVKIPSVMSTKPLNDAPCEWKKVSPETVGECSAVGFYFARMVNRALHIPVGLVLANKGGSRVESWLSEENLKKFTDEPLDSAMIAKQFSWDYHRPLLWGNGTFSPILNYTIKGILFYQGCSNVGMHTEAYADRLALLVKQWRDSFGEGDVPFYFVQIAPYAYGDGKDGTSSAYLREQQLKAADLIPNSGIVCTNDCVYPFESGQIHPRQKQPVGERLAFQALNKTYGFKNLPCESMRYKSMTVQGDTCYIRLQNDYNGISRFDEIQGFEVAGSDKVFHKASAGHFWVPRDDPRNETVYVTSPEVKNPVAVRYCFKNFQTGNLKSNALLPLFPFRTDNW
ncbi:MAG: 9-O-acetylesterase [Prevotella sp.]|nr:9-O-acetylesterase [Prevotella sp.]